MTGLFTVDELAEVLGLHKSTIRRRLAAVTPFAMMGRRPLYTMAQWDTARADVIGASRQHGICQPPVR